jgi:hypothetical protein
MHIPREICIYCQFITYVWCITKNVSSVFTEIIFDEAGHTGFAPTIQCFKKAYLYILIGNAYL